MNPKIKLTREHLLAIWKMAKGKTPPFPYVLDLHDKRIIQMELEAEALFAEDTFYYQLHYRFSDIGLDILRMLEDNSEKWEERLQYMDVGEVVNIPEHLMERITWRMIVPKWMLRWTCLHKGKKRVLQQRSVARRAWFILGEYCTRCDKKFLLPVYEQTHMALAFGHDVQPEFENIIRHV